MSPSKHNLKRTVGAFLGILIALLTAFSQPPPGLSHQAMLALGIFLCSVVFWITEVFADYVTALLMCTAWAVFRVAPFSTVFAQFSSDSFWLLIGAFGLGVAVTKSGLLNRASLLIMLGFPASFRGQTAALITAGNIIGPLIPSVTAKCAIAAPFARGVSDKMGYERNSQGAAGLFGAMFMGFGVTGPAFLSSSFMCYTIKGLLPASVQAQLTWTTWAINALPWTIVMLVLGYIAIQLLYRPENETRVEAGYAKQQLEALGPMTRDEKIVLAVLLLCLSLWMTEKLHGILAANIALGAICILMGLGVFGRNEFKTLIPWDAAIFVGCIINIASVFPYLKIDRWIGQIAGPYLTPLVSNIWLYILIGAAAVYLVRFVIVSMVATFSIFTVIITPFAVTAGVNPFITGFVILASVNVFHMLYQNSTYLAGYYAAGNMVEHRQMIKLALAYMAISILGLLACIPIWSLTGLL